MTRVVLLCIPSLFFFTPNFAKNPAPTVVNALIVQVGQLTPVSCFGGSDGAIDLEIVQGQAPFIFEWSHGEKTQNASGLSAGFYQVTVTDGDDNQVVLTGIEVLQPDALEITFPSIVNIDCLHSQGAITADAQGGTPGYQYAWSNGQTGTYIAQLNLGVYTVTVTDAQGCIALSQVSVVEDLDYPYAEAGPVMTMLCSTSTGQLLGSGSSGTQFSYQWTASAGGHIAAGGNTLEPAIDRTGVYTLTVTNDNNGCTAADATIVTSQHQSPYATATGGVLNCENTSVQLQAFYNPLHTIFEWQGPDGYVSNLQFPTVYIAGNYVFRITDTLTGCISLAPAPVIPDITPPLAEASTSNALSCFEPTAVLTVLTDLDADVSFKWTGPNNYSANTDVALTTLPGTYTAVVTNLLNGCSASAVAIVTGNTTPPVVNASANGTLTCVVSGVTLTGNVQPANAAFQWTGPNGYTSSQLSPVVNMVGLYTLNATNLVNGCTATAQVTVSSNTTAPDLTATGGTKTCASPTVTLHAYSNTPNLTFSWTGPGGYFTSQQHPMVSQAGFYTVVATNPVNGCTSFFGVTVALNTTPPVLIANGSSITCANPLGKPTAYTIPAGATFAWTGPSGYTSNQANPSVPYSGFYTVTATSTANGCTAAASVLVEENNTPPYAYAGEPKMLNCMATPVMLNGFGSTPGNNISYLWTTYDGNVVSGAQGLYPRVNAVGTYTLTVTNNSNGCTAQDSVEVTLALPVTATIQNVAHVTCHGTATGSATVQAGGGIAPYTYSWSNGSKQASATGLSAGLYTVTLSDSDGCTSGANVLINQPAALQAIASATPQTIYGVNNGSASVSVSGGTVPYTYIWNTGAIFASIFNLAPGMYTVTVTDNKGCTAVRTATVNAVNCTLNGSAATTPVSCFGAANGSATANITGGVAPLSYKWSNNALTKTISNLGPGTYTVTVTDASGCTLALSAQVNSPAVLQVNFISKVDVLCSNAATGALTAGVSGGTAPYTFVWSTGGTGATRTGLAPGVYTVTASDANSCTQSQSAQIVIADQNPPQLILKNATVALNSNGLAELSAALFDNGSFDAECSIASWTIAPTAFDCSQLGARVVTLTATDINGNSKTGTATATIVDQQVAVLQCPQNIAGGACQPAVQFALPQIIDNCAIQPNNLQQTGGLPSGADFPIGKTIQTFLYTDPLGNTAQCSFEVTIAELPAGTVEATPVSCQSSCDGMAIVSAAPGNSFVSIHWSDGQSGPTAIGLCPGFHVASVTDSYGCTAELSAFIPSSNGGAFEITTSILPVSCQQACDGQASLSVAASAPPFNIVWSDGQSGLSAGNLCPGQYMATITDAQGCSQVANVQIDVVDDGIPTLICPGNITAGPCNPFVQYAYPEVQDNCPGDPQLIELVEGLPSGTIFPQGATVQRFQYTDAAGNTGECSFTVTVADPALELSLTDVTCMGACNGVAVLSAAGGHAPFTVQWNNGNTGMTAANLCAGTYGVTVVDASGCAQTRQFQISQPASSLAFNVLQIIPDVGNTGAGSIQIAVNGGTAPYSFNWMLDGQPFASTQNLEGLYPGVYTVLVTDANGCTVQSAALNLQNTVAVLEIDHLANIRLHPNPARAIAYLNLFEATDQDIEVSVYHSNGALAFRDWLRSAETRLQLDVSGLATGWYVVHVRAADGQTVVRKLAVER